MKYMLMMYYATEGPAIDEWVPEDIKAHVDFMHRFNRELTARGELVAAEGLAGPDQVKVVRAKKGSAPVVTDGPFPEAKEFLAGFWIVDVESLERAVAIAAGVSAAPGFGGVPMNIPIELRQAARAPGDENVTPE